MVRKKRSDLRPLRSTEKPEPGDLVVYGNGLVIETRAVTYKLPVDVLEAVDGAAYRDRLTKTAVVEAALRDYLNV